MLRVFESVGKLDVRVCSDNLTTFTQLALLRILLNYSNVTFLSFVQFRACYSNGPLHVFSRLTNSRSLTFALHNSQPYFASLLWVPNHTLLSLA